MAVASSAGVGFAATASTLKDNASLRWDAVVGPIAAILAVGSFFLDFVDEGDSAGDSKRKCSRKAGKAKSEDDGAKNVIHQFFTCF